MRFDIFGPYEVGLADNGLIDSDQSDLWEKANSDREHLDAAIGCYLFGIRNGENITPWYVGQTVKRDFSHECFTKGNRNNYDQVHERNGSRVLLLIPALTPEDRLTHPAKRRRRDIDFLEDWIMGTALFKNPRLLNRRGVAMLRDMRVPGILNPQKRDNARLSVIALRNALRIK